MYILKTLIIICLILFTGTVQAASDIPWEWTLFVVGLISAVIATILARKNDKADGFGLKFLLAGLYFWIAVFAQTIVLALLYHLYS